MARASSSSASFRSTTNICSRSRTASRTRPASPSRSTFLSRVTRIGHPPSAGYAALHEGFIGVIGDTAEELNLRQDREGAERHQDLQGRRRLGRLHRQILGRRRRARPDDADRGALSSRWAAARQDLSGRHRRASRRRSSPARSAEATTYVFAGAKEVDTLDAYKANPGLKRFDLLIDWGWFYFITRPMFRLIDFLYKLLGNFGLAILCGDGDRQARLPAARQQELSSRSPR